LGEEPQSGAACWKLESRPKQTKASQYTSSQLWIRKDNYVIVRIDHYKKDKVERRIDYSDVENVQGIWTPKKFEVADIARNSRTVMKIDDLKYNAPMQDSEFTVEALRHAR
jgi:outer membrane lipoprotein-sorting protein